MNSMASIRMQPKSKLIRKLYVVLMSVLTLILAAIFCGILLLTGLGGESVQARINSNVQKSVDQLKIEGVYPQIISSRDYSYRLDNFTDITILQESMLMNTSKAPETIFSNPRLSKSYENAEYADNILSLEEAAKTNDANSFYTYYWIGIRALIRPLLTVMTYQSIRGVIAVIFVGLFVLAAVSIYKALGSGLCGAFVTTTACMNIPIITSEIQYVPCFWVAFLSIYFLIEYKERLNLIPVLFYITGAFTQFLDFYTFPVITLGFP